MEFDSEKTAIVTGGYLEKFGSKLIDNGYSIVPIEPGKKAPGYDDWQKTRSSAVQMNKWLDQGKGGHGVGVISALTPGIDIDVLDDVLAAKLEEWCLEHLGPAPIRVGQHPKRLLVYRTDEPFRKITSKTYVNEWNERCRIEILGDGQQFVAHHMHPGTGRPYKWVSEANLLNTPAEELTLLPTEKLQDLIALFESEARALGWNLAKGSRVGKLKGQAGEIDYNDPFAADSQPVTLSQPELHARLMMAPGAEDYDTWLQVGMALFHQYAGEEIGKEMWHEWSESAENYDGDALDRKWDTFDIGDKGRAPITARLILQLAKEAAETNAIAVATGLRDRFAQAVDRAEWNEIAKEARAAEIDHLSRAGLAEVARDRLQVLTGSKVPLPEVKKALAYEINSKELPRWVRDWVYDVSDDRFFNIVSKCVVTPQGFNAMNDRWSMTKKDILEGKSTPTANATHLALNVYKVPVVQSRMYSPGQDPVFFYEHEQRGNTYPENQVPARPKQIRPIDKRNVKIVKRHIAHLFPDPLAQTRLLDWLSYVVQNPGKRVNYAPLLQGVQGDGKSFFAFLLAAVMGGPNVRQANAHILEGSFTGWAEGQCVMAIEEIRLVGHNRHDILNRIKPFITNPVIEIHAKGRNPYNVVNTTNYLMFTNYRDAMPLSQNERRFLVLFSQWQSAEDLRAFIDKNPDYYLELYNALEESAPALRVWLLEKEQSEAFDPRGNAPRTAEFDYMVTASLSPDARALHDLIEDPAYPEITNELLNVTALQRMEMTIDVELPQKKALDKMLEQAGFWPLGRHRIGSDVCRFYSKIPSMFQSMTGDTLAVDLSKIKAYLKKNVPEDDDDL